MLAAAGILALAGCAEKAATVPQVDDPHRVASAAQPPLTASSPPVPAATQPAAAAGGACGMLDYDRVAETLGERFQIAVAGGAEPVATCVLKQVDSRYPDLTLAAAPTKADAKVFAATVAPKGAKTVAGLGKAAYSRSVPPDGAAGTSVEVGWLSANGRLLTVRYALPAGGNAEVAGAVTPKLVALAQRIETGK